MGLVSRPVLTKQRAGSPRTYNKVIFTDYCNIKHPSIKILLKIVNFLTFHMDGLFTL